jgi:hypothetical protein
MIWYMSGLLCLVLFLATLSVFYPESLFPFLTKRWKCRWYYMKSGIWQWPSLPAWFNHQR